MSLPPVLYLSRKDVETVDLPMSEIISALETMFREKGDGRVENPPKPGIHPGTDAFIHAMPAFIPSMGAAGVKWVAGYPHNPERGLPYISGLLTLNDPETGLPIAVMDATWITAKRTGAATAVAAKHLARSNAKTLGILACGVQGRSNLEALSTLFDLQTVRAYDIDGAAAVAYADEMRSALGLTVEVVEDPIEAVADMDLVVTSGPILKNPAPTIEPGWLKKGAFASPVDFDSYWHPDALREADKLATDDIDQMEYYRQIGYFQTAPRAYADLGQIVAGLKPGRQAADERTICMNLGLASDDMATAILIYERARQSGIGTALPL